MIYRILLFAFLILSFNSIATDNHKIVADQNGNIFVFGLFSGEIDFPGGIVIGDFNNTNKRCFIAKYDSTGICLWARDLVGSTDGYVSTLETGSSPGIGLTIDNAGNIYITANFKNTLVLDEFNSLVGSNYSSTFLAKYTTDGLVTWSKRFQGPSEGVSIELDDFGHLYTIGHFKDSITIDGQTILQATTGEKEVYVCKMDLASNVLWINSISKSTGTLLVNSVAVLDDQSVYIVGRSGLSGLLVSDNITAQGYEKIYFAKFSSSGTAQWIKVFGDVGPWYYGCDRITSNSQNELIAEGQFQNQVDFEGVSSPLSTVNNNSNPFVVKFDGNGTANWSMNSNPQDTGGSGFGNDLEVDNSDNIWFAAKATKIEYSPLQSQFVALNSDIWHIVKLDNAGNGICQILDDAIGARPIDITTDQFGNAYFVSAFDPVPSSQMVVGKIDPNCSLLWTSVAEVDVFTHPIGLNEIDNESRISVSPNPADDVVNIDLGHEWTSGRVELINVLGESVFQADFEEEKNLTVQLESFPAGTYYLEVTIGESHIERVKLIKL